MKPKKPICIAANRLFCGRKPKPLYVKNHAFAV